MSQMQTLSDTDLLAMMVGPKTAQQILQHAAGSLSALILNDTTAPYEVLPRSQTWVQSRLLAAKELVRRSLAEVLRQRDCLSSPQSVRDFLRVTLQGRDHEVFLVMFLNNQNRLIAVEEMFRGTLTQTSVYPREIVKRSLFHNCGAVIFCHNHPSGIAEPSSADEMLTRRLKEALALVDVRVADHFIVASHATPVSFAERGLL